MLYLVSMSRAGLGIDLLNVQAALAPAHSFYRFADTSWAVCTNDGAAVWDQRLRPFVLPGGSIFICRLNKQDFNGLMPQEFWNWLSLHNNV